MIDAIYIYSRWSAFLFRVPFLHFLPACLPSLRSSRPLLRSFYYAFPDLFSSSLFFFLKETTAEEIRRKQARQKHVHQSIPPPPPSSSSSSSWCYRFFICVLSFAFCVIIQIASRAHTHTNDACLCTYVMYACV